MHIYKWEKRSTNDIKKPPNTIPETFKHQSSKEESQRGVATCKSQAEVNEYLKPHIIWAKSKLALESGRWKDFNIYFGATAGLRLLDEKFRINLLKWVRDFFADPNKSPFKFEKNQATILSGEEEGIFGWLTVNLALGSLQDSSKPTAGAVDMGGASMQITFEPKPSSDILEDLTVVKLFGKTRRLYSHSFLEFGANEAEERMNMYAFRSKMATNPCYNTGYQRSFEFPSLGSKLVRGEYNAQKCEQITNHMLWKRARCFYQNLCSINGVYQPTINKDMIFYAFSTFGYTIRGLKWSGVDLKNPITLNRISQVRDEICSMNWEQLKKSKFKKISPKFLANRCFVTTYMMDVLSTGFGFEMDSKQIMYETAITANDGKKYKLTWATGAILYYSNLLPFEFVRSKMKPEPRPEPQPEPQPEPEVIPEPPSTTNDMSEYLSFHTQTEGFGMVIPATNQPSGTVKDSLSLPTPRMAFGLVLGLSILGISIFSCAGGRHKEQKYDQISV